MSRLSEALKDTIAGSPNPPRGRQPAASTTFSTDSTPSRRRNSAPSFSPSQANVLNIQPFDNAQAIVVNNLSVFDRVARD
ncbi:hypothetical protein TWF718_007594 [Orbilia javanica]|uniref:Uncharacterized protein n=1 Tax=Orbilia javanica TaxID=47235 RepID=A0AAN8RIJ4_9PEZI